MQSSRNDREGDRRADSEDLKDRAWQMVGVPMVEHQKSNRQTQRERRWAPIDILHTCLAI